MPLYDILNEFQKGHSHIAVVYKDLNANKETCVENVEGKRLKLKASCKKLRGNPMQRQVNIKLHQFLEPSAIPFMVYL